MSTNQEFIKKIATKIVYENILRKKPLYASVVIAQAILETGWGKSNLMMKANALFGIKATSSWTGKVFNSKTNEVLNGVSVTQDATFRAYDKIEDSISDYFNLILNNSRYSGAINKNSPLECITGIKNGGYATDPDYVSKIMSIINSNNLIIYDVGDYVDNSGDNSKSIDEIVNEVIAGKWGNQPERQIRLENAGYNYNQIQNAVNNKLSNKKSIDEIAKEVIKGKYGNQPERQIKLEKEGYNYIEVQNKVNELMKG